MLQDGEGEGGARDEVDEHKIQVPERTHIKMIW